MPKTRNLIEQLEGYTVIHTSCKINGVEEPRSWMWSSRFDVKINSTASHNISNLCLFFKMIFYGSYHGRSPLNHHLGNIFYFIQPPNSRKSKETEVWMEDVCILFHVWRHFLRFQPSPTTTLRGCSLESESVI